MLRQALFLFPSSFLTHELGTDFLFTLKTEKPFKPGVGLWFRLEMREPFVNSFFEGKKKKNTGFLLLNMKWSFL